MIVNPTFVSEKLCNGCGVVLPRDRFTFDARNRDGLQGKCNSCRSESKKRRYYKDVEKARATRRSYYRTLSDEKKKNRLAAKTRNPVSVLLGVLNRKKWIKERTPKWANTAKIRDIYADAKEFRNAGISVHVDHIIPLRGKLVSGLHVHDNLTVKLSPWNDKKGNKYDV